jgi:hypothetical protein
MRLLAIGYALPHPEIDNHTVFNSPSYFDYDALFVDPASITGAVAQLLNDAREFESDDGRPVVNAATTASAVSAADQLRRRAEETQRLLESGGLVIVTARPNATQGGVLGFEGCDRYSWLPAPAAMAWGPPFLRAAEGKTLRVTDETHPFSRLIREFRRDLRYRGVFDDRQAAVRGAAKVFAVGGAGVPIGVEFPVLAGRVVFIPAFPDETGAMRTDLADKLVDAVHAMLHEGRPTEYAWWARTIPVPGLEQVEAEVEEAEQAATTAGERLTAVRERHDALAAHRRLLVSDGPDFQEAAVTALQLLGCVRRSAPGEPLSMESEGQTLFVECEGSKDQVVEWPYVRLQRRLEAQLLQQGEQLKGVVVVNGHRGDPPDQRKPQFTDALRIACENYRYCLLTGETLFELVRRALGGAEEGALIGMRRRMLATSGLLETRLALGEVEESQDTGPIF